MPRPLALGAIRSRYVAGGPLPPPKLLRALALDPRKGAQELHALLVRRRATAREEQIRLAALLNFERVLWKAGIRHVAGVDEVGMGPLAGPVVAAAVVLPPEIDLAGVDDSKRLDAETRERLDREIRARAVAIAVAEVDVATIDRLNIYHAGLEAMRRAILALGVPAEHVLTDARTVPGLAALPQNAFDKGDGLNYSIACASIVAKVHRDRLMCELAREFPGYGFERHKGYSTAEHMDAVRRLGTCAIHRTSFPVLRQLRGEAAPLFYELREAIAAAASVDDLAAVSARIAAPSGADGADGAVAGALAESETRKLAVLLARRRARLAARARPGARG